MDYLSKLNPVSDKYNGSDYVLAWRNLPDDVTLPIPSCAYQEFKVKDENGEIVLDEEGVPEVRYLPRLDVIAVLFWAMIRREAPDITIEEVSAGINNDNLVEVTEDIFYFWTGGTRAEVSEVVNAEDKE